MPAKKQPLEGDVDSPKTSDPNLGKALCLRIAGSFRSSLGSYPAVINAARELHEWAGGDALRLQALEITRETLGREVRNLKELRAHRDAVYDFLVGQPGKATTLSK